MKWKNEIFQHIKINPSVLSYNKVCNVFQRYRPAPREVDQSFAHCLGGWRAQADCDAAAARPRRFQGLCRHSPRASNARRHLRVVPLLQVSNSQARVSQFFLSLHNFCSSLFQCRDEQELSDLVRMNKATKM